MFSTNIVVQDGINSAKHNSEDVLVCNIFNINLIEFDQIYVKGENVFFFFKNIKGGECIYHVTLNKLFYSLLMKYHENPIIS